MLAPFRAEFPRAGTSGHIICVTHALASCFTPAASALLVLGFSTVNGSRKLEASLVWSSPLQYGELPRGPLGESGQEKKGFGKIMARFLNSGELLAINSQLFLLCPVPRRGDPGKLFHHCCPAAGAESGHDLRRCEDLSVFWTHLHHAQECHVRSCMASLLSRRFT